MDWIRRNWPDLLIGVALVAVIAMIVATLLSGGSLNSLLQRNTPPELPITSTTGPAGTEPTASAATDNGTATPEGNVPDSSAGNLDVFVPGVPSEPEATTPAEAATGTAEPAAAGSATTQPATAAGPAAATGVNAPLPTAVPGGGFRVAAGAVDSRDGALTAAQTFRDEGYTVTIEQQGELYLLWIGPYASDAGAERVATRLQTDELVPDALVYTYDGEEDVVSDAGTAPNGGANPADATGAVASAPEGTAQTQPTAVNGAAAVTGLNAPSGQQFLQVGAFRSDESAVPQRQQLEELGLNVTSSEDDSGIVRLYVGPFAAPQLAQTRNQLSTQGIDSFPVTP